MPRRLCAVPRGSVMSLVQPLNSPSRLRARSLRHILMLLKAGLQMDLICVKPLFTLG
jgi:hypothetical protein